jgi:hypothetical protein
LIIMSVGYQYARFRWWDAVNIDKLYDELKTQFKVEERKHTPVEVDASLYRNQRDELIVQADTLIGHLAMFHAVLSQKESKPFTQKDLDLRKRVLELYPHERPSPFPWEFSHEPEFKTES